MKRQRIAGWLVAVALAAGAGLLGAPGCALFTCLEDACDELPSGGATSTSTTAPSGGGGATQTAGGGGAEDGAGGAGGAEAPCDPPCAVGTCADGLCQPECVPSGVPSARRLAVGEDAVFVLGSGDARPVHAWAPELDQDEALGVVASPDEVFFAAGGTVYSLDDDAIICRSAFGGVCTATFPCALPFHDVGGEIDGSFVWLIRDDGTLERTATTQCQPMIGAVLADPGFTVGHFAAQASKVAASGEAAGLRYVCRGTQTIFQGSALIDLDDARCSDVEAQTPSWIAIDEAGVVHWREDGSVTGDDAAEYLVPGGSDQPFDIDDDWVYASLGAGNGITACSVDEPSSCRTWSTRSRVVDVVAFNFASAVPDVVYFIDDTELCRWTP